MSAMPARKGTLLALRIITNLKSDLQPNLRVLLRIGAAYMQRRDRKCEMRTCPARETTIKNQVGGK